MAVAKDAIKNRERLLASMILVSLICGWVAGLFRHHSDIAGFLKQALPGAVRFDSSEDNIYTGLTHAQSESKKTGFVAIRSAYGYAGPVTVAVGLDANGKIVNAVIVRHTKVSQADSKARTVPTNSKSEVMLIRLPERLFLWRLLQKLYVWPALT